MDKSIDMVAKAARLLGPRQAEILMACQQGDDLLGANYPTQRRQRLALVAKGLIELHYGEELGYMVTPFGKQVAQHLAAKEA